MPSDDDEGNSTKTWGKSMRKISRGKSNQTSVAICHLIWAAWTNSCRKFICGSGKWQKQHPRVDKICFATIIPRYGKIWCRKVWAQVLISTRGIIQDKWKIIQFELTCLEIWTSKCWAHEFLLRVSLRQCCTVQVVVVWVSDCCGLVLKVLSTWKSRSIIVSES